MEILDGEINGKGAAELVRLFADATNSERSAFPPEETTIQIKRLVGGITSIEMSCGKSLASISFNANDWSKPLNVESTTYNGDNKTGSATLNVKSPQQRPYRNLVAMLERACW